MRSRRILAVDLGAERTAYAAFSTGATGRLVLQRFWSEPLGSDATARDRWSAGIARALAQFGDGGRGHAPLLVTLPAHLAFTKYVKTPAVAPSRRTSALEFEAAENIPHPLGEVVWDCVLLGDDGLDLEVVIAAAKLDFVRALCAAATAAGHPIERATPPPFALLRGFRFNHPQVCESTVVANVGARSTTLIFLEGERAAFRTLALGGALISQRVADALGLELSRADHLKQQVLGGGAELPGNSPAYEAVHRAAAAFTAKLSAEIMRSSLHYRLQSGIGVPTAMYIAGAGALVPGLAAALEETLGWPVRPYNPLQNVAVSADARASGADVAAPQLANLVGLATELIRARQQPWANLVPPLAATVAGLRGRRRWTLTATVLLLLALLPPIVRYHRLAELNQRQIAELEEELRPMRRIQARNAENLRLLGLAKREIDGLRLAYGARSSWLQFLGGMQDYLAQVEDVWLDSIRISTTELDQPTLPDPRASAPSNSPPPLRLAVSGRLLDVANPESQMSQQAVLRVQQLLAHFAGSPFVAKVENEGFDRGQHGLLRFDFTVVLNPTRPL